MDGVRTKADLEALYRCALTLLYGAGATPLPADTPGAATVGGAVMLDDPDQIAAVRDGESPRG